MSPPVRGPEASLRIPLQTGGGFSMNLFLLGFAFAPAVAVALLGLFCTCLGHWVIGPCLLLLGGFFMAAFWSFPRETWVARPADLELDQAGFRVIGGYYGGVAIAWEQLDARACRIEKGSALLSKQLVAVRHSGERTIVAEGEEEETFRAALDAFRSARGAELSERSRGPAKVQLISCPGCGAPIQPVDAATSLCAHCGQAVPVRDDLRQRLRSFAQVRALRKRSERALARLLAHPSAPATTALLGLLGVTMLGSWLFGLVVVALGIVRLTLDLGVILQALVAPALLTIALALVASVIAVRRVALRSILIDFAAVAPGPGSNCPGCRVCGAPLPASVELVAHCAYCSAPSIVSAARPRRPEALAKQAATLDETLANQSAERMARWIFLVVCGLPCAWGAYWALRALGSGLLPIIP